MVEVYLYGEWRALARSEVRGQIAEVKNKGGFYLCTLTSHL
jgi:hypothetical protein